jgi:RsmE family RNA methyltransferase
MNLILFEKQELDFPLALKDERAKHILNVLKAGIGDTLQVGLINGPTGTAVLKKHTDHGLEFEFTWRDDEEPPLDNITLVVGLSRPHTSQKILQQATTLGVKKMLFIRTELGEGSYASSKLWSTGEYKQHLLHGAQQAGSTHLPRVEYGSPLWIALHLVEDIPQKIALHNGEDVAPFTQLPVQRDKEVVLAIGSERGWTDKEIAMLQRNGFTLASMGKRILRTETAVVSGLTLLKAKRGVWG